MEDIKGEPMPGDFHEVLGNQLYMQGQNIEECELGKKIYFAEGEMPEEFEAACDLLGIGETSELVKTANGYHIIKKLPVNSLFIT